MNFLTQSIFLANNLDHCWLMVMCTNICVLESEKRSHLIKYKVNDTIQQQWMTLIFLQLTLELEHSKKQHYCFQFQVALHISVDSISFEWYDHWPRTHCSWWSLNLLKPIQCDRAFASVPFWLLSNASSYRIHHITNSFHNQSNIMNGRPISAKDEQRRGGEAERGTWLQMFNLCWNSRKKLKGWCCWWKERNWRCPCQFQCH